MVKGVRLLRLCVVAVFALILATPVVAKYNKQYQPVPLIKRLSFENFRNIKMLQAAIINYGGGQAEVERLVDQYAEASALYFQNKIEESADLFSENEREIMKVAKMVAARYYEDVNKMLTESIKYNIKYSIRESLKGKKQNQPANKLLNNARFSVQKANDYYDRYKDATSASARGMISAIYYYRRAKENMFLMHELLMKDEPEKIKEYRSQYKKDIADNNNRVYREREKVN